MDIKITKQHILILKNRKYYILDITTAPSYSSKQVQIDEEIFNYSWVHERRIGKKRWVISIVTEKEHQFEGKKIYFIPDKDN